jgi:hypothetical protein
MSGRLDTKQQTDVMDENQYLDRKSLRVISRDHGDFPDLARDCVGFANSASFLDERRHCWWRVERALSALPASKGPR